MIKLSTQSEEMLHLDALRFLASMLIVLYHWNADLILRPELRNIGSVHYLNLAVDLFFTISGIVMCNVYYGRIITTKDFTVFLKKRIARLYPLHLATLVASVVIGALCLKLNMRINDPVTFHNTYDMHALIPNIFMLHSLPFVGHLSYNAPSWSISAEMICYLIIPFVFFVQKRHVLLVFLCALFMMIVLTWCGNGIVWTEWTYNYGPLRALPAFMLGIVIASTKNILSRIPFPEPILCATIIAVIVAGAYNCPRYILYFLVYVIAVLAVAADMQKSTHRAFRSIAPLGCLTYSIYMLHGIFQQTVFPCIKRAHLTSVAHNTVIFLCLIPMILISYISYVYFETPARRRISSL